MVLCFGQTASCKEGRQENKNDFYANFLIQEPLFYVNFLDEHPYFMHTIIRSNAEACTEG